MLTNELVFFWVTNELDWVLIIFWKKIQFYALKENNKKNKIEYPFYYKGSIDKNTAFSLLNTLTLSLPLILRPRLHLPLSRVFFFFFFLFGFFFPFYFHFHFSSSISIFFPFFFRWIELLIPLKTLTLEICDTKKKNPNPQSPLRKMQQQHRFKQHAMMQQSLYHHPALLATAPQVPFLSFAFNFRQLLLLFIYYNQSV